MADITVNLNLPLNGVQGEVWYAAIIGGQVLWYKVINIPVLSIDGVVGPFYYNDGMPGNMHKIIFPQQTIDGETYQQAETKQFLITSPQFLTAILTPIQYTLSLNVDYLNGNIGDPFTLTGVLMQENTPIAAEPIDLLINGVAVGSTETDVDGQYLITWIADQTGTLDVNTQAPYL